LFGVQTPLLGFQSLLCSVQIMVFFLNIERSEMFESLNTERSEELEFLIAEGV
jgi:hypothetical protein